MEHRLKTWPPYFDRIIAGQKTFELRKNDRDFQVGDRLLLEEWKPGRGISLIDPAPGYTGRTCLTEVVYVLTDGAGLAVGFVVLGIKLLDYKHGPPIRFDA